LLGGSFNPAHAGHLHVSREALRRLDLDDIWWLVSPQNPLKPAEGMAGYVERVAAARSVARADRRVRVSDLEVRLRTRYSADTLRLMRKLCPLTKFVWLMGADNLAQITAWDRWTAIYAVIPIAIFARKPYDNKALLGVAAHRYAYCRVPEALAARLAFRRSPAWVFLRSRHHPASATAIRRGHPRPLGH
jgi:nicotinate-nucleotide adenylyltransferase